MNKNKFAKLVHELLIGVAELLPESKPIGGFHIYSTKNSYLRIPLIITENEFNQWLNIFSEEKQANIKKIISCRMGMICVDMISYEDHDFKYQLVFNPGEFKRIIKNVLNKLVVEEELFLEAHCAACICHEIRHLLQLGFLSKRHLRSSIKAIKLSNDSINHIQLKRYWQEHVDEEIVSYREVFSDYPEKELFLRMEKDAAIMQLLAFDCWIDSRRDRNAKVERLKELLR
jgi:hypothetical protein